MVMMISGDLNIYTGNELYLMYVYYYFRHFNEEYGVFLSMPDGITMTGGRVILLYISEL